MKIKLVVLLHLLFSTLFLLGQQTTISGSYPSGKNEEVIIVKYADFISNNIIVETQTTIDTNGRFSCIIPNPTSEPVFIEIGSHFSILYIEPDTEYTLHFDTLQMQKNDEPYLIFELSTTKNCDINTTINGYNNLQLSLLDSCYNASSRIFSPFSSTLIKEKTALFKEQHSACLSPYTTNYIDYKEAALLYTTARQHNRISYLPLLLQGITQPMNDGFHYLYNTVFNSYVEEQGDAKKIITTINEEGGFSTLLDTLKTDTLLTNHQLCELVALSTITSLYQAQKITPSATKYILGNAVMTTNSPLTKQVASNCIGQLPILVKGNALSHLGFKTADEEQYDLPSNSNPTYIMFFNLYAPNSKTLLQLMNFNNKKYQAYFNFVAIAVNGKNEELKELVSEIECAFPVLQFSSLQEAMKVTPTLLPEYLLLNNKGVIELFPAPRIDKDAPLFFKKQRQQHVNKNNIDEQKTN